MIDDAIFVIAPAAFGTLDGSERELRKREEAAQEASEKYINTDYFESARVMMDRLEAKKAGNWDEKTGTIRQDKDAATSG